MNSKQKSKQNGSLGRPKTKNKRRKGGRRTGGNAGNSVFDGHMHMVIDPCAAPLSRTIYSGATGIVTRHVSTGQLAGGGSDQALMMGYVPSGYRMVTGSALVGSTAFTPSYTTINVPGYNFLLNTSAQSRVVGACLQIHWNGTEMNRGGTVAYGCFQASGVPAVATTIDNIFALCPRRTRVVPGELEIRWNPTDEDESYSPCDGAITVDNFNDRNGLYFAFQGPTGAAFGYTLTVLVEWLPKIAQGQPAPPTVRSTIASPVVHINSTLSRIKHWGHGAADVASNVAAATSAVYSGVENTYKLIKGVGKMVETVGVPLLL